jgi:hypothetical protein
VFEKNALGKMPVPKKTRVFFGKYDVKEVRDLRLYTSNGIVGIVKSRGVGHNMRDKERTKNFDEETST